jgi:DNA-binding transcriptional regulator YdaS (Cro superfamily)
MEQLRTYLNSLSIKDQERYAKACGTSLGYLRKAISIRPRLDGELCRLLDENSKGAVPRESIRPDIWPERLNNSAHLTKLRGKQKSSINAS